VLLSRMQGLRVAGAGGNDRLALNEVAGNVSSTSDFLREVLLRTNRPSRVQFEFLTPSFIHSPLRSHLKVCRRVRLHISFLLQPCRSAGLLFLYCETSPVPRRQLCPLPSPRRFRVSFFQGSGGVRCAGITVIRPAFSTEMVCAQDRVP